MPSLQSLPTSGQCPWHAPKSPRRAPTAHHLSWRDNLAWKTSVSRFKVTFPAPGKRLRKVLFLRQIRCFPVSACAS
jgi:hypothetical protein